MDEVAQAEVFYGFSLPLNLEEEDLIWPEGSNLTLGVSGHYACLYLYVGISETIQSVAEEALRLNISLFNSDGLIYEWQKEIEKFCEVNRISIKTEDVGWHLSSCLS